MKRYLAMVIILIIFVSCNQSPENNKKLDTNPAAIDLDNDGVSNKDVDKVISNDELLQVVKNEIALVSKEVNSNPQYEMNSYEIEVLKNENLISEGELKELNAIMVKGGINE